MSDDIAASAAKACCAAVVLFGIVSIITVLASLKSLGNDEQLIVHYLDGKVAYNGPSGAKVYSPFREKETRSALKLTSMQYARIRDELNGGVRIVEGAAKVWLGAYEETDGAQTKFVLKSDQFIRMVDKLSGVERIVTGPTSVVPGAWEHAPSGVEQAAFVNSDTAIILLNKVDGTTRLYKTPGLYFPKEYEEVLDTASLTRVLATETMVVRNAYGNYVVYNGSADGSNGKSFFLEPYEEIVEFEWSVFSENVPGELQSIGKEKFTRIDSRTRKSFFQYDMRTKDNVAMRIEGTIFWAVKDVGKLVNKTADPVSDVWYRGRNVLTQAVSQVNLQTFMNSFAHLTKNAYTAQVRDDFYAERGILVVSMEVTKYECIDQETADTLQAIIDQTTDKINALQAQKAENDVKAASLAAEIKLESEKTALIRTQSKNDILMAELEGEAAGTELATSASTFIAGLNESVPDESLRVELYKLHRELELDDLRTKAIASSKATTIFLTPEEISLDLSPHELQEL
mmetsp:Transcript_87103/g.219309  ORF Transcript_87103/g.219309 Transcript_87103/m.219309 type:complete len:515 (+) Transcript_87103:68-1612(+)